MRPVDADVVDVVLAVAQQDHTVDDGPRVGGQRSFGRVIRRGSADDRPLTPDSSSPGSDRPALSRSVCPSGRGPPLPPSRLNPGL
jgi:hypothetical protein